MDVGRKRGLATPSLNFTHLQVSFVLTLQLVTCILQLATPLRLIICNCVKFRLCSCFATCLSSPCLELSKLATCSLHCAICNLQLHACTSCTCSCFATCLNSPCLDVLQLAACILQLQLRKIQTLFLLCNLPQLALPCRLSTCSLHCATCNSMHVHVQAALVLATCRLAKSRNMQLTISQ